LKDNDKLIEQVKPEPLSVQSEAQAVCGPNTTPYTVREGDTFFTIARQFGVSLDALVAANPQIPDPSRIFPGQTVCIPGQQPTQCPPGTFSYTVQPGDSMFTIAQRFGVSLDALIAANPQIPDPNVIFPGQIVCVPTTAPPTCPPGTFSYTVQPGDSMFTIAQRFGVSLNALIAANPQIPDPSLIFPGQIVCVPTTAPPPPTTCPPGTFRYTVQPGDSMWRIAQRFGVSLNALIAANPQIPNPSLIFPGQIVCVPTTAPPPPTTCPPGTFRYTVQPGDSMWKIAQRFGVSLNALIAANPQISDPSRIFPGQIVCVPNR
jgi:spore coat assembly protein SafA